MGVEIAPIRAAFSDMIAPPATLSLAIKTRLNPHRFARPPALCVASFSPVRASESCGFIFKTSRTILKSNRRNIFRERYRGLGRSDREDKRQKRGNPQSR